MRRVCRFGLRVLAFAVALVALEQVLIAILPRSVFYRDRRPTRAGRFANRLTMLWSRYGGPPAYMVELETHSPRSGRPNRVPVVIGAHAGNEYAVSMLGDRSVWVRNLRADGNATLRHGRRRAVRLVEVYATGEKAKAIKAYLRRAPGARPHIPIALDAPMEEFARIAADYPVFRIVDTATEQASRTTAGSESRSGDLL
jgi:hypothetical protein